MPKDLAAATRILASLKHFAIADADIDANIDASITGVDRDFVRAAMKNVPAEYRSKVIIHRIDGSYISNRTSALSDFVSHSPAEVLQNRRTPDSDGIGGESTGAFRRISLPVGTGTQMVTVVYAGCSNAYIQPNARHAAYILTGPVGVNNNLGVDAGYQYYPDPNPLGSTPVSPADTYQVFYADSAQKGINQAQGLRAYYPCGDYLSEVGMSPVLSFDPNTGQASVTGTQVSTGWAYAPVFGGATEFETMVSMYPLGGPQGIEYDGTDSKLRRELAIAQIMNMTNFSSGEYFGLESTPAISQYVANYPGAQRRLTVME